MQTLSACRPSPLQSLNKIAGFLNASEHYHSELKKALSLIGRTVGAGSVAVYKKYFLGHENFSVKCLGSWKTRPRCSTPHDSMPEFLKTEDLSLRCWKRLEAGKFVFLNPLLCPEIRNIAKGFLAPLFLAKHFCGVLALSSIEEQNIKPIDQEFLSAACRVLELWLSKLNLEKRLDDIMDFIPNPTFIMTTDELITTWNRATEKMTGWKAERMLGKDNYESSIPFYNERRPMVANLIMYPDWQWEKTYPEFHRQQDRVYSLAYCPALPGGGTFLRCDTQRLYDINNRLRGAIHTVRDVTHERQIEENLHRSESMYRAISDFAGVGIMLLRNNRVLYYNERLAEFLAFSGKDISREDFINWVHPEDRQEIKRHSKDLLNGLEEHLRFEFRAGDENGYRFYRAYAQLTEYEDHAAIHFILDDITEQIELARKVKLNELRLYHEDRLSALGIMAAGIAHELNQPLNTIRVVTDGLLFGREEGWELEQEELFENLEMVSRQVVRMSEIIQNIRNFAREDQGLCVEDVNANEAIENVFSMIGRQLEAHGINIQKDLALGLPPINTNLNRLEQVIMNLIVNARQALDACSHDNKELRVATGSANGSVFIKVSDNGSGIPDELSVKIFDPFFTTKEMGNGTGLGLSISQTIVAEFKGRLEVFNNEKGGATFVVTAPSNGC